MQLSGSTDGVDLLCSKGHFSVQNSGADESPFVLICAQRVPAHPRAVHVRAVGVHPAGAHPGDPRDAARLPLLDPARLHLRVEPGKKLSAFQKQIELQRRSVTLNSLND